VVVKRWSMKEEEEEEEEEEERERERGSRTDETIRQR
jgi:hypothetical protein